MELSQKQLEIKDRAIAHARENKKAIAKRETDRKIFVAEEDPVSVFMAGSPGAGKTEASIELLNNFSNDGVQIIELTPMICGRNLKNTLAKTAGYFKVPFRSW